MEAMTNRLRVGTSATCPEGVPLEIKASYGKMVAIDEEISFADNICGSIVPRCLKQPRPNWGKPLALTRLSLSLLELLHESHHLGWSVAGSAASVALWLQGQPRIRRRMSQQTSYS